MISRLKQRIIIKLSINEKVKPFEILHRLNAHFEFSYGKMLLVCYWLVFKNEIKELKKYGS